MILPSLANFACLADVMTMSQTITATLIALLLSSACLAAPPDTGSGGIRPARATACGDLLLGIEHKPPRLGFYCCGWDSIGAGGRDGWLQDHGASYTISMGSGETLLNRREDWPRIPWFSVTVTRYLEEP
jgi:hypothetical protein